MLVRWWLLHLLLPRWYFMAVFVVAEFAANITGVAASKC